jgi:hypothetical protein
MDPVCSRQRETQGNRASLLVIVRLGGPASFRLARQRAILGDTQRPY